MMGNVVKFRAYGKEYGLSVVDNGGNKWVMAQQVGEALGNKNIKKLIYELKENGELQENKHLSIVTLLNPKTRGNPRRLLLSYRGIIRVAMRSQGQRAKEFRDWAEEVLFQVMVTGVYYGASQTAAPVDLPAIESRGIRKGLAVAYISSRLNVSLTALAKLCKFRRMGLTQKEAGLACGLTRHQVQTCERYLREIGVEFPSVNAGKRNKEIMEQIGQVMLGLCAPNDLHEGGAV